MNRRQKAVYAEKKNRGRWRGALEHHHSAIQGIVSYIAGVLNPRFNLPVFANEPNISDDFRYKPLSTLDIFVRCFTIFSRNIPSDVSDNTTNWDYPRLKWRHLFVALVARFTTLGHCWPRTDHCWLAVLALYNIALGPAMRQCWAGAGRFTMYNRYPPVRMISFPPYIYSLVIRPSTAQFYGYFTIERIPIGLRPPVVIQRPSCLGPPRRKAKACAAVMGPHNGAIPETGATPRPVVERLQMIGAMRQLSEI